MNKVSKSPLPKIKKGTPAIIEMNFPEAMVKIIAGLRVHRLEWQDKNEYGLMRDSYLMIHRNNKFFAWTVSEGDLLATDWVIVL